MPIFVADEVVTAAKLNDATARDWADWSPSYANLTVGNGVVVARFLEGLGGLVIARYKITFGSSSAMGTGPTISLPVTATADSVDVVGPCHFHDVSAPIRLNAVARVASTTLASPLRISGTDHRADALTSALPFTWATGDILSFTITYEVA